MDVVVGVDDEWGCIYDNVRWKMVDFLIEVGNLGWKVLKIEIWLFRRLCLCGLI